jgi:hypothetical protein
MNIKKIMIYGLLIISVFSLYQWDRASKAIKEKELMSLELMIAKDSIVVHTGRNGSLSFKLLQMDIEKGNLRKAIDLLGITNKELKDQDIKKNNIISVLQGKIQTQGHGATALTDTILIVKNDTIFKEKTFKWQSKYMYINGHTFNDSILLKYKYSLDFSFISAKQGKNTIVTAKFNDPNMVLMSAQSIVIKPRKPFVKWWMVLILGVTGGYLIK